jgi:Tfp pilus assembly protein PilO
MSILDTATFNDQPNNVSIDVGTGGQLATFARFVCKVVNLNQITDFHDITSKSLSKTRRAELNVSLRLPK